MKLAPLLAQFLYTNKRLDLPGIGVFLFDGPTGFEADNGKQDRSVNPPAISFENKPSNRDANDLVEFIAAKTGKQKALAAADLDSHLELIQQFLNIGKPFLLEGVGNLVKLKSGEIAFTSGQALPESLKDYSVREISSTSSTEQTFSDYRKVLNQGDVKTNWRKPAVFLLVIAGIGFAIWGGYTVYKMNSTPKKQAITNNNKKENDLPAKKIIPVNVDTTNNPDTIAISNTKKEEPIVATGKLKYIIEKAEGKRAFERLAKLRSYFWPVQLETKDSVNYTLYMILPSSYADTTRILDSLTLLNGKRVHVEK